MKIIDFIPENKYSCQLCHQEFVSEEILEVVIGKYPLCPRCKLREEKKCLKQN